jgi:hypothetical protein
LMNGELCEPRDEELGFLGISVLRSKWYKK